MTQDDDIVVQAGQLARFIRYVMDHFWFLVSGLVAVIAWGALAMFLEPVTGKWNAIWVAAVCTIALWLVVFCLFSSRAIEQSDLETLSNS